MQEPTISELFPEGSRLLLTGGGKEFIERVGVEAARQVVLGVLKGENVRTQTEPLTRRRIAQVTGAMIVLFARGAIEVPDFSAKLSTIAVHQIETARKNDNAAIWPAQWLIGLTGKSVQNVLRSNPAGRTAYLEDYETAIHEAAARCLTDMGAIEMTLGFLADSQEREAILDWRAITQLTTAIGSATLTIRGSDKSIYGKLFERLVLGSVLTILGLERVNPAANRKTRNVFWLSDSSDTRECDATVLLEPGRLLRFDIGFIGPGNSEISKDKLSRYANQGERGGVRFTSKTFIVVDRLPQTSKTQQAANAIGAEIIQMSMHYWPRDLARRLRDSVGYAHEICDVPDAEMGAYLAAHLENIAVQDFLIGIDPGDLEADADLPEGEVGIDAATAADDDLR